MAMTYMYICDAMFRYETQNPEQLIVFLVCFLTMLLICPN